MLDAGTSGLRSVSVAADGEAALLAACPWPMFTPEDTGPFGREFDAAGTIASFESVLGAAEGPFRAIAFTGQREGVVFADASLDAVCISPNVDARASAEGIETDAASAAEVYRATGHLPSLMQVPAKMAWLRRCRPRDAARVRYVLPLADWLAARLTAEPAVSRSLACENGLFDIGTGAARTRDGMFGPDLLRRAVPDGSVVGAVTPERRFAGTPVVLAGGDSQCALVGLGAMNPGDSGVSAGWTAPLQLVTAAPIFDDQMRTWTGLHVAPDLYVLESNAGETGRSWAWICEMLGEEPAAGAKLAASAPVGSHDAIAVLGSRVMRAAAMNAGLGALIVPLPLVMSAPSRADMLRSVLESIGYAIRANLEQLEEVGGRAIPMLRLGGGMSRSSLFTQIVADVIDRPVQVARTPEVTALGAGVLAAVATGVHGSMPGAASAMCAGDAVVPVASASAQYEDGYARWCALADGMAVIGEGA